MGGMANDPSVDHPDLYQRPTSSLETGQISPVVTQTLAARPSDSAANSLDGGPDMSGPRWRMGWGGIE